jgi:hypothetical protein
MAGLDIVVYATSEPISLEMAKRQLQIDATLKQDDDYINGLIVTAREKAELHTNRSFLTRTFREYYDGFPGTRLPIPYNVTYDMPMQHEFEHRHGSRFELSRSPLQAVVDVMYLDQTGTQQTLDPSLYYIAPHKEPACLHRMPPIPNSTLLPWPIPLHRADSVWVDYLAGYGSPITIGVAVSSPAITGYVFAATDIGRPISIPGAGPNRGTLHATIATVIAGVGVLSINALETVASATAWLGKPLPGVALTAMLMLISHWYENRLPVAQAGGKELPYAVRDLLDNNRVYYQA